MALACCAGGGVVAAAAQGAFSAGPVTNDRPPSFSAGPGDRPSVGPPERTVAEWLVRLQQGSRVPSYVGTFVVSAATGVMSSARIWHVSEGDVQLERVESLTGAPRSSFRRNDVVVTFLPATRTVRTEQREGAGVFPNLLAAGNEFSTSDYYRARQFGRDRVAGFDADMVWLYPRDALRFGYRVWSEARTGLVLKTQTLDAAGRVLEQAAFSELQLDVPVQAEKLRQMMAGTHGYRVDKTDRVRTTAETEGWVLKSDVPGFKSQSVYRNTVATDAAPVVQWIFSDGLATVSLFLEPLDSRRHGHEGVASMGATHTLAQRLVRHGATWWVTAVGEVPTQTLRAFVEGLDRIR